MHDTLSYLQRDPIHRVHHHNEITFSILYAWSENYVLPISHDEVVHGKGALVNKFPGDRWQKLATLRALYGFMWAHPGKKLLFMGCEFAQNDEWNESQGLQWSLMEYAEHQGVSKTIQKLNAIYKEIPALSERDTSPEGFTWLVGADAASNILAFSRWDESGRPLVCITNFSPTPHENYSMSLPLSGQWKEVINTDDMKFGGTGMSNPLIESEATSANRVTLRVPPLATIWLEQI